MTDETLDVLIIGAGLSGINAAYRLRERNPGARYAVVEARESLGGTWDLFRYPGVRSDSDFFTLSFPFNPWAGKNAIVSGEEIRNYLTETVGKFGIDSHIHYSTKVVSSDFSSDDGLWTVSATRAGEDITYRTRFVFSCTGYYDYDAPHDPGFAGLEDFGGTVVHPQFWPEELDVTGKNVTIIGSGATAITLVPALAKTAAQVTMLQRTPTYILAQPWTDPIADLARKLLPATVAHSIIRGKNTFLQWALYQLSQRRPKFMRKVLRKAAVMSVGSEEIVDTHFNPPYDPWDQRLCIAPGADFYKSIRAGDATVVTDRIARFVENGIELESGQVLESDVVVTATGLTIKLLGGIDATIDGEKVNAPDHFVWNGCMISDVPNFAFCVGYVNLSWTMRSDMTARLVARIVERLLADPAAIVTPHGENLVATGPLFDMESGYFARSIEIQPKSAGEYPWALKQNYRVDSKATNRVTPDDPTLVWTRATAPSPVAS